jgi:hypothetical protein
MLPTRGGIHYRRERAALAGYRPERLPVVEGEFYSCVLLS